jgi:RNA polymerase I-specific transcription initiation factor RRN6
MLPYAPDIGISETFGTESIGTVDVQTNDRVSMDFSLSTSYPEVERRITHINGSSRRIWSPSTDCDNNDGLIVHKNKEITPQSDGIAEIASFEDLGLGDLCDAEKSTYLAEDKAPNTEASLKVDDGNPTDYFDPCVGKLSNLFEIRSKAFLVVSTGDKSNVLQCGMLDPMWKGWKLSKVYPTDLNDEVQAKKIDALLQKVQNLRAPKFILIRKLTFNASIQQIETYQLDSSGNFRVILVRTTDSVHVLRCTYSNSRSELFLSKLFNFQKGELWADLAHCSMRIGQNWLKLVIVDCVGKFTIFRSNIDNMKVSSFQEIRLKYKSFHDPVDLSNFKKSLWINDTRLILYSRLQLHEYRLSDDDALDPKVSDRQEMVFQENNQRFFCRICAGIWTRILDIVPSETQTSVIYMLTTKEIIMVDVKEGFKRRFAWKHFLNDRDISLHLTITKNPRAEHKDFCIIASKQVNFNVVLEFDAVLFKLIVPPYIMHTAAASPNKSLSLRRLNKSCNLFLSVQKEKSNEVSLTLYDYTSKFGETNPGRTPKTIEYVVSQLLECPSSKIQTRIYEKLHDYSETNRGTVPTSEELTMQIYQRVDNFVNQETNNFGTLSEILNNIHIPKNIKNIFKIVQHLARNENLSQIDIRFIDNMWISDQYVNYVGRGAAEVEDLKLQAHQALSFFKSLYDIVGGKEILINLLLSSFGVWKNSGSLDTSATEDMLAESLTDLPENYQDMIKSFEDDFDIVGIMDSEDYNSKNLHTQDDPFLSSMMSMPTVSVSNPTSRASSVPILAKGSAKKSNKRVSASSSRAETPLSQISQKRSFLDSSQMQLSQPFSQKFSQQKKPGLSQLSQGKGSMRKKRKTGFR